MKIAKLLKAGGLFAAGSYFIDALLRPAMAAKQARATAVAREKPLLEVSHTGKSLRKMLLGNAPSVGDEHVEIDDSTALLPYGDKEFGALIASHVLEHLEDPISALKEWERVADELFVIVPWWWTPHALFHPGHRWIFFGSAKTGMEGRKLWQRRGDDASMLDEPVVSSIRAD